MSIPVPFNSFSTAFTDMALMQVLIDDVLSHRQEVNFGAVELSVVGRAVATLQNFELIRNILALVSEVAKVFVVPVTLLETGNQFIVCETISDRVFQGFDVVRGLVAEKEVHGNQEGRVSLAHFHSIHCRPVIGTSRLRGTVAHASLLQNFERKVILG